MIKQHGTMSEKTEYKVQQKCAKDKKVMHRETLLM